MKDVGKPKTKQMFEGNHETVQEIEAIKIIQTKGIQKMEIIDRQTATTE